MKIFCYQNFLIIFFFSAKSIKNLRELSGRPKRGNALMVFISVVSLIRCTTSPALFSSYQNKKCARDEVSKYTVTLVLDLRFPNTSVQYDASHCYWHQ